MPNPGEMQLTSSLQWLPPGWKVEVKTRSNGERDKVYIDPVNRYRFQSKLDVLRYLGLMEPSNPKERDRSIAIRLVQDGSLDESLDWLPFNWQVELRERKNGAVDKYYAHPVSGYIFRSKKQVLRYLQNGEMPRVTKKRRVYDEGLIHQTFPLPGVAKIQKQGRSGTRRCLLTGQSSNTRKVDNNKRAVQVSTLSGVYASEQCWKGMKCYNESELLLPPPDIGASENRRMEDAYTEKKYIIALSAVLPQKRQVQSSVGMSRNKKPKLSPQKTENEREPRLALRTSRRLAGLEPELPPELGKGKHIVLAVPKAEVKSEKDVYFLGGEEQPNELGKTYEEGDDAAVDCTIKLAFEEPESEITLPMAEGVIEKYEHSPSHEEKPNEPGKTSEDNTGPPDYLMKLASVGPDSEITIPSVEVDAETYVHSLVGVEKPNEIGKLSKDNVGPPDYLLKLESMGPYSDITMLEVDAQKDMHSLGGVEQPNDLGEASVDKDALDDYPVKLASKGAESVITMPRVEVDAEQDVHSLGGNEQPNELRKTSKDIDALADYPMKLASKEPESKITMPRVEEGTQKDMHSLGRVEQQDELVEKSADKDGPDDYLVMLASKGAESVITMPRVEVDAEQDVHSLEGNKQPNELGKTSKDNDAFVDYPMKLASKEPESKITMPKVEVDAKKVMHSLGSVEQPNELVETSANKDAPDDHPVKLAPKGAESGITIPRVEVDAEQDVHSLGSNKQPDELGKTSEDKDALADYPMKLACKGPESKIPMPKVEVDTQKDMDSLGGNEHPDELGKTSEDKDALTDYRMKLASKGPEFKITMPKVEMDTQKDMHSLGCVEQPNELIETFADKDAPDDYLLKLAYKGAESVITMPRVEVDAEQDVPCLGGNDQPNELGKTSDNKDALADYPLKLASKGLESKITMPKVEVDTQKDMPSLGCVEQPNELVETSADKDTPDDYPVKLASKGAESVITMPKVEVQDVHSLGGNEQPNELGKTSEDKDALLYYPMKLASKGPESKVTMPRVEVDTQKDIHSLGCAEQPDELVETSVSTDKDAPDNYPVELAPKGAESSVITMPRVEVDAEQDVHSLGGNEQSSELGKTSENKDVLADYLMKLPSKKPESKITMPRVEVDTQKDMHSLGAEEQPNELRKRSEDRDIPADNTMKFPCSVPEFGFMLPFGESSLDPCLEFAYKTLVGIIPMENLPIKDFLHQHVTSVSTQNAGCLKWQDLHGMANLSLTDDPI